LESSAAKHKTDRPTNFQLELFCRTTISERGKQAIIIKASERDIATANEKSKNIYAAV